MPQPIRDSKRPRFVLLIATALALGLPACASLEGDFGLEPGEELPPHRADPAYDTLFPRYAEVCAVSQFRTRDGQTGGSPGHGVLYLRGACVDREAGYPRLRRCDGSAGEAGGAGISVNRWLKNVNWLAIPGRDLFVDGGLPPGEPVTDRAMDQAVEAALAAGVFDGVTYHDYPTDAPERSISDLARRHVLGTDFGIALARTMVCARTPITGEMLEEAITYLNGLNRQYAERERDYHWSVYYDNCVHVLRNALAAAGLWKPKAVHDMPILQILHVPVPANEYLQFALRVTEFPIEDFDAIWSDPEARDALLEFNVLPARHGSLLTTVPVRRPNEHYDPDFHLLLIEPPHVKGKLHRAEALVNDPRATDLERNLRWFVERYRGILAARPADEGKALQGSRKRPVRRRYYRAVEANLADAEAKLAELEGTSREAVLSRSGP